VDPELEEYLIGVGVLREWDADDAGVVAAAVQKLLHLLVVLEQGRL
jgi:hypothetical protein